MDVGSTAWRRLLLRAELLLLQVRAKGGRCVADIAQEGVLERPLSGLVKGEESDEDRGIDALECFDCLSLSASGFPRKAARRCRTQSNRSRRALPPARSQANGFAVRLMVGAPGPRSRDAQLPPLELNDSEMSMLLTLSAPIDQRLRPQFLQEVAQELEASGQAGRPGAVHRVGRTVQRRFSDPPQLAAAGRK
jgi:hypothetical protein